MREILIFAVSSGAGKRRQTPHGLSVWFFSGTGSFRGRTEHFPIGLLVIVKPGLCLKNSSRPQQKKVMIPEHAMGMLPLSVDVCCEWPTGRAVRRTAFVGA